MAQYVTVEYTNESERLSEYIYKLKESWKHWIEEKVLIWMNQHSTPRNLQKSTKVDGQQSRGSLSTHRLTGDSHCPVSAEILGVGFIKIFQEIVLWVIIIIGLI